MPSPAECASSAYIHRWTTVKITGSKYSPWAACPHLQNVHPRHIFTAGTCTMSLYLSLAASTHLGSMSSPAECASSAYIHRWKMYGEHVLITGSKYSALAACPHLQNVHPQHLFTMYDEYVLIIGSKYSPLAASPRLQNLHPRHIFTMYGGHVLITGSKYSPLAASPHLQNVHPRHIFTTGPCTVSMYLSLAASTQLWQHVLTCRMCILGIYSHLDLVR
jgi:hypothetical protein